MYVANPMTSYPQFGFTIGYTPSNGMMLNDLQWLVTVPQPAYTQPPIPCGSLAWPWKLTHENRCFTVVCLFFPLPWLPWETVNDC